MSGKVLRILFLFVLTGCADIEGGRDRNSTQRAYDSERLEIEQKAMSGEITWVLAEIRTRELDKYFAYRKDLNPTWKYDRNDEEYHAYCIALAERLDKREITYAAFNASRLERFNAIQARQFSLYNQQQLIENSRRQSSPATPSNTQGGIVCFKRTEWTSGVNKNCVYDCAGSEAVQTVGAAALCPLTIQH
jgi:hypothetical protein